MMFGAKSFFAATGAAAIALGTVCFLGLEDATRQEVLSFYQRTLRQPLFAGLLTVSTFLFSLKTFIIINMKTHVYDRPEYENEWLDKRQIDGQLQRYAPLRNFSLLLFFSVLISLAAALSQFTVGLVDAPVVAFVCLSLAAWSISMIFVSLFFLQVNLRSLFRFADAASETKAKKQSDNTD